MERKPLHLGTAYHGNRQLHHAAEDMKNIARSGLDTVVHMFSHNDWDRHSNLMKEMVYLSQEAGLDVWVDNWGLGGPPGDKSHFLSYYPDSHVILSDGSMDPVHVCVNSEDYRRFVKDWIDKVDFLGAKTIFWDEPRAVLKEVDGKKVFGCACKRCRKLFADKYGREMPLEPDADVHTFLADCIADFLREITDYSHSKGMTNTCCVMIGTFGMSLDQADKIAALPHMDNIGSDPYWVDRKLHDPSLNVYNFVRSESEKNLSLCEKFGKEHNIWIQGYANPRGSEEDIVTAAEAIYDAGARTILSWGYYGSDGADYMAKNPDVSWAKLCEAYHRLREMERDTFLAECRKNYKK